MSTMNLSKVKSIAHKLCGEDNYYEELRLLKEDISFFTMYMRRNKKSHFDFNLRMSQLGSHGAFDKLWECFGYGQAYVEDVYPIFEVLKGMIMSIYEDKGTFTNEEIKDFNDWLRQNYTYDMRDFVFNFMDDSEDRLTMISKIQAIVELEEDV